jgi:hypothetical protein
MVDRREHWEAVYQTRATDAVSWFQPHAAASLRLIARYVAQVLRAVKPGGHVTVAAFGPGGPLACSGLDVVRYDPGALHAQFGAAFRLLGHETEVHYTPAGKDQEFVYCYCMWV